MSDNKEFKIGDKVYYVDRETDSEVEGYIFDSLDDDIYAVKIRNEERRFAYLPSYRLTWIDPPNWESLEENLIRDGIDISKMSQSSSEKK